MPRTSSTPAFSEQPIGLIDLTALKDSRFLVPEKRALPYRDQNGAVNINFLDKAAAQLDREAERWDDESRAKLRSRITAWQKAARTALAARPEDERMTLDELFAAPEESKPKGTPAKVLPAVPSQPPALTARTPGMVSSHAGALPGSHPKTDAMRRRLFRKPRAKDEPLYGVDVFSEVMPLEVDLHYLGQIANDRARKDGKRAKKAPSTPSPSRPTRSRRLSIVDASVAPEAPAEEEEEEALSSDTHEEGSSQDDSSEIYEVEAVLAEDESPAQRGFLIRWAGYGQEDDTWEPEENLAQELVAAFRYERGLARSNRGEDYMLGRTRMFWCAPCLAHHPVDNFSALQRKAPCSHRACLSHHYKVQANPHRSLVTGAAHETPTRTATHAEVHGSGQRKKKKRARDMDSDASDASADEEEEGRKPARVMALWAPAKPQRSVARALNNRQAALEVANSRKLGFGML